MTGSNQHSSLDDLFVDDFTLLRQSLPQHHVSSESDYAPGHPALDALTRIQEQLEALQRERDEVIRPAVLDTVAEYRAQVKGLQEQFDAMRDFLVDLVDSEWGKQTPPYTGSFEPMNQWITSNPAREPMEDS